jgi:hypothetical protein
MNYRAIFFLAAIQSTLVFAGAFDRQSDTRTMTFESIAKNREIWGADIDFGLTLNRGNVERTMGGAGLGLFHATDTLSVYLNGSYFYGAIESEKFDNKGNATLRFDYKMSPFWKLFFFSTHSFNEINKIDYRATHGLGPWLDFKGERFHNAFSVAIVHQFENFPVSPSERAIRLSIRDMMKITLTETSFLGWDIFYVPAFSDFSDFHLFIQPFLEVYLASSVSIKYLVSFERDNRPQPEVEKNDLENQVQLKFSFGE